MLILQQMIIFVLLMAAGALARRYEILTPANQPQITKLVVNIAYPAIILSGVTGKGPRIEGAELAYAFGVILIMLVLLMISAWLLPRILRYPKEHYGIINVMVIFTNIGFMGVPMIDGIYGKDALIYMTVLLIPFNILFFSYVIQTICHPDHQGTFRQERTLSLAKFGQYRHGSLHFGHRPLPERHRAALCTGSVDYHAGQHDGALSHDAPGLVLGRYGMEGHDKRPDHRLYDHQDAGHSHRPYLTSRPFRRQYVFTGRLHGSLGDTVGQYYSPLGSRLP